MDVLILGAQVSGVGGGRGDACLGQVSCMASRGWAEGASSLKTKRLRVSSQTRQPKIQRWNAKEAEVCGYWIFELSSFRAFVFSGLGDKGREVKHDGPGLRVRRIKISSRA